MTTYNKSTLKTFFEQNDVPQGSDYANLIDSQINIVETALQSMGGALATTELIAPRVSAANIVATQTVSAVSIYADNLFANNLTAVSANLTFNNVTVAGTITASAGNFNALTITGDVSATSGTVYASAMRSNNGFIGSSGVVSAAGTTQGTAAILTNVVNRGKGIVDGTTTGFTPLTNKAGLVQYFYNEGVSANLWPPTGGTINGLAVNAAFALAASAAYTIFHITASSYGVK